jgi:predicted small secreted protein
MFVSGDKGNPMRVILIASSLLVLAGCNTMSGLGKDIQKGGEAIERKASK